MPYFRDYNVTVYNVTVYNVTVSPNYITEYPSHMHD